LLTRRQLPQRFYRLFFLNPEEHADKAQANVEIIIAQLGAMKSRSKSSFPPRHKDEKSETQAFHTRPAR
jgi:hypothetical protein